MPPPTVANPDHLDLLGFEHSVVLAIVAACAVLLSLLLRRIASRPSGPPVARVVCWSLAGVLLAGSAASQVHQLATGTWSVRHSLPLHLCDIGVFVTAMALLGASIKTPPPLRGRAGWGSGARDYDPLPMRQRLFELAYFWGVGGTTQAVVTPDVEGTFPSVTCLRYFLLHGGIVVSVLALTVGLRMRPRPGAVGRVWVVTFALAVVVMLVNWICGSNYMYLCGPPAHPTLYNVFGPWPWALLTLVLVGTLIFILCYVPFWLADRRRCRQDVLDSGSRSPTL